MMTMTNEQPTPNAADAALLTALDAGVVAAAIQAAGCGVTPVEQDGVVLLHSASQGIGFQVLWGNPAPVVDAGPAAGQRRYADLTLSCPLRVQGGTLPESLLSDWHRAKRFARVARHGEHVVLEMDVIAVGGISRTHLEVQLQLWTQMMGQFFSFLRNFRPEESTTATASAASESTGASASAPVIDAAAPTLADGAAQPA
ncbi:YbjN domain-containing protein [Roseateles chitosanitabidus]|uniref:YbjN domain-containing protein n=1 Tax=Roseateles chitosanitabidus TaxID=65048 RepID=UPI0008355B94|nr:YbjN domain-containing protein [Roseateles chitosanitabidus]